MQLQQRLRIYFLFLILPLSVGGQVERGNDKKCKLENEGCPK